MPFQWRHPTPPPPSCYISAVNLFICNTSIYQILMLMYHFHKYFRKQVLRQNVHVRVLYAVCCLLYRWQSMLASPRWIACLPTSSPSTNYHQSSNFHHLANTHRLGLTFYLLPLWKLPCLLRRETITLIRDPTSRCGHGSSTTQTITLVTKHDMPHCTDISLHIFMIHA